MLAFPALCSAELETGGHLKTRYSVIGYPSDSVYVSSVGSESEDYGVFGRLNLDWREGSWAAELNYQLIWAQSDFYSEQGSGVDFFDAAPVQQDHTRAFDLSEILFDSSSTRTSHRIDRLALQYHNEHYVFKVGRQAISWGNGLAYAPMDFLNPFDPAAFDKEFKPGDDMLYMQRAFSSGNDIQLIYVVRRPQEGSVSDSVSTAALKYHGFLGAWEYDILMAQHYDESKLGLGFVRDVAGGIWRGDIVSTKTEQGNWDTSLVTSLSYSATVLNHNVNTSIEIFRNGFGVEGELSYRTLMLKYPDLLEKIERGELFSVGRNYLSASATIELAPLWLLSSNIFFNLDDDSSLWQIMSRHDLAENLMLTAAVNVPVGDRGSEFGGRAFGESGREELLYTSVDRTFDIQLAWYF